MRHLPSVQAASSRVAIFCLSMLASMGAIAQAPDCPKMDAPRPTRPPGKPPTVLPQVIPPQSFGGEVKVLPPDMPPVEEFQDADEGHLAEWAREPEMATMTLPQAASRLEAATSTKGSLLDQWTFRGYAVDDSRIRLLRYFTQGKVVLHYMVIDTSLGRYSAPPTTRVGAYPARAGAFRTPSGCVSSSIGWDRPHLTLSLRVVGPVPLDGQRRMLQEIADSIERPKP